MLLLDVFLKEVMSSFFFSPIPDNNGRTSDYFPFLQHRACRVRHICPIACCLKRSKEEFDALDTRLEPIFCMKLRHSFLPKYTTKLVFCPKPLRFHGDHEKVHHGSVQL